MRTVTAVFTAATERRFDELGAMLAAEIDWHGLPDQDGQIPRCHGRAEALEQMGIGLLANNQVSVSALVEAGDRVLARVHRVGDDQAKPPERFLVDRATVYAGEGSEGPIITEAIEAVTGSIAFMTAPQARGRGIARAMITAILARPELDPVKLFEAGVEPDNVTSRRCLEAAGFCARVPEPDFEGMLYYRADRRDPPTPG